MLIHYFALKSRSTIILHDSLMIILAWLCALGFNFNWQVIPVELINILFIYLAYSFTTQSLIFWYFGLYKGVWRFSSLPDLMRIFKAIFWGGLFLFASFFIYNQLDSISSSIIFLHSCFLLIFLCLPRLFYRYYKDCIKYEKDAQRALIIGAGTAGDMLVRDLLHEKNNFLPIAFVDDNNSKKSCSIRGIPVLFDIQRIPEYVNNFNITIILIAIPSASDSDMRRIVEACEQTHIPFKTLPAVKELFSNTVSKLNLRDVAIADILGRDPVNLNWEKIQQSLSGKRILITGGGGSIGSELCKQLARVKPACLIIYDQSEFNLYQLDSLLKQEFPNLAYKVILGNIIDRDTLEETIYTEKPQIIFHAAAYKHVPLLEAQTLAAVNNNLIGTKNVAELALSAKIERFVLISTDKAVNPTNVMGATKRAAEILCQHFNTQSTTTSFITVRFGNVLDSAGSVVPLFRSQIKAGGPITVTHPDVTRYFMTIPEACRLIMKAEAVGTGGEIYVLDMGSPIKIRYLAEKMIRLSGLRVDDDIKIKYIGLRAGEKLHEELFHEQENLLGTGFEKLFLAQARHYKKSLWEQQMQALLDAFYQRNNENVIKQLKILVPEFTALIHE